LLQHAVVVQGPLIALPHQRHEAEDEEGLELPLSFWASFTPPMINAMEIGSMIHLPSVGKTAGRKLGHAATGQPHAVGFGRDWRAWLSC
jgi:hypothetical protein